jgi:cytoskeletal protein CcmA (bactofilin family)
MRPAWAFLLFLPVAAGALDIVSAPRVDSRPGEVYLSELFIAAETADLRGAASNDLFLVAGSITLAGTNAGDVWAFGRDSLRVTGVIEDDARLAGRAAEVEGRIGGNLAALASSVRLGTGAVVGGTASITADDAILLGTVQGDLHITAARVTLGGRIAGNVRLHAAEVVFRPDLDVTGDLVCTLPEPVRPPTGVRIGGATQFLPPPAGRPWPLAVALIAALYAGGVIAGLPLVGLVPRFSARAATRLRQGWPRCMLAGLAVLFAVPAVCLVAFSWTVTIPLGAVLAVSCAFAAAISAPLCALALGGALRRSPQPETPAPAFAALALGMIPIVLAAALPGSAFTVALLVVVLGTGTLAGLLLPARRLPPSLPPPPPPG